MQIARIAGPDGARWCVLEDGNAYALDGDRFASPARGAGLGPLEDFRLLRPMEPGNKVICLLSNWRSKDDRDGPGFFIKPPSMLIDPGDPIVYPDEAVRVVYEPEIAVVIGRRCRSASVEKARHHVLGYTCFNDVTAFEMTATTNFPFLAGKSFDTFGVAGPAISTGIDADGVSIRAAVNGCVLTDTHTSRMLWSTDEVVSWISTFMTLNPGDLREKSWISVFSIQERTLRNCWAMPSGPRSWDFPASS